MDSEDDAPQSNEVIKFDQPPSGEDLGNTIQRLQPLRKEITTPPLVPREVIFQAAGAPPAVDTEDLIVLDLDAPIIRILPTATSVARKDTPTTPMPTTAKPKKKKAKVKRDVIDDIFG